MDEEQLERDFGTIDTEISTRKTATSKMPVDEDHISAIWSEFLSDKRNSLV